MSRPSGHLSRLQRFVERHRVALVWVARLIVGATFLLSGWTKMTDPWGFVYKIEQYLAVWHNPQPRGLVLMGAGALATAEFLLGLFMATGSYKRAATWCMTVLMAFMLPLTVYIWIADPVADCGCFGDLLVISNLATMLKNVVLTLLLIWLCTVNAKVDGLFSPYVQWLQATLAAVYMLVIGVIGYTVQPLVDFRPYKVGSRLVEAEADGDDQDFIFIYEKDGQTAEFTETNLPDSTWTFIDRRMVGSGLSGLPDHAQFTVYTDDNEPATDEAFSNEGDELVLLVPDVADIDISTTYVINELAAYIEQRGGSMIGVLGTGADGLERWRNISMATYPLYTAEDTAIKEVARGYAALMWLQDGVIQWKRSLTSIDADIVATPDDMTLERLRFPGNRYMVVLTAFFLGAELLLLGLDKSGRAVALHLRRRKKPQNQKK